MAQTKTVKSKVKAPKPKKEDLLDEHGYSQRGKAGERHAALTKVITLTAKKGGTTHDSAIKVVRRLSALQELYKQKKSISDTYRRDANWVKKNHFKEKSKIQSKKRNVS